MCDISAWISTKNILDVHSFFTKARRNLSLLLKPHRVYTYFIVKAKPVPMIVYPPRKELAIYSGVGKSR